MRSPKSIMITGASSGLGAALARHYAAPGIRLALTGRDAARLEAVASACREAGATIETSTIDVTNAAAIARWIRRVDKKTPIDLGIVNAGITGGTAPDHPHETYEAVKRLLHVNLDGAINTVAPLIDCMSERGRGQIALMSSLAGLRGLSYSPAYSASKAALVGYGEALRGNLHSAGISVNVICPGFVETPLDDSIASPKPFRIGADRAARIIKRGLERDRPRIGFPWLLYRGTLLMRALPQDMVNWFMTRIAVSVPEPERAPRPKSKAK